MTVEKFSKGDLVCHHRYVIDSEDAASIGYVTNLCPGPNAVHVRTLDGRYRIWTTKKMTLLDKASYNE